MTEKVRLMMDVPQIWEETGHSLTRPGAIEEFIEEPLRAAMRIFMSRGIVTYYSSANQLDLEASIVIPLAGLSPVNLALARQKGWANEGEGFAAVIHYPVSPFTPVSVVEAYFVRVCRIIYRSKYAVIASQDTLLRDYIKYCIYHHGRSAIYNTLRFLPART